MPLLPLSETLQILYCPSSQEPGVLSYLIFQLFFQELIFLNRILLKMLTIEGSDGLVSLANQLLNEKKGKQT